MSEESKGILVSLKQFAAEKKAAAKKPEGCSSTEEDKESWAESIKKRNAENKTRLSQKRKSTNKHVLSSYQIK